MGWNEVQIKITAKYLMELIAKKVFIFCTHIE